MAMSPVMFNGLCFFLLLFNSNGFISFAQAEEETDLYEAADYHLGQLERIFEAIAANHHGLYKRAATLDRRDKILQSLAAVCSELNAEIANTTPMENNIITSTSTTIPDTDIVNESVTFPSEWPLPSLFLNDVEAERDGDTVTLRFNVTHISQASVHSQDFYSSPIGPPGKYSQPATSQVQLSFHASECTQGSYDYNLYHSPHVTTTIQFTLLHDNRYNVEPFINLCLFDRFTKTSAVSGRRFWYKINETNSFYQQFAIQRYRIISDPGDTIFIEPGHNAELVIDIVLDRNHKFLVNAMLYDWETKEFIPHGVGVDIYSSPVFFHEESYHDSLLILKVLKKIAINDTNPEKTEENFIFRVKVIVVTGSRKLSGKLSLDYINGQDEYFANSPNIVESIHSERMIWLKLPYNLMALPGNTLDEHWGACTDCELSDTPDRNCNIYCYAEGTDIDTIFILKNSPYKPPIKTVSYVKHGFKAYAENYVGPPSEENDGTYKCFVIMKNGDVRVEEIELSTDVTKIQSAVVEDLGNGTTMVTCSASGHQPVNVSVSLEDSYYSIVLTDEQIDPDFSIERVGNQTILTMMAETDKLHYPKTRLGCYAEGPSGSDTKYVYLPSFIQNYDPSVPFIIRDTFSIEKFDNGTTSITCSARGTENFDIKINRGETDSRLRLDDIPESTRTITTRENDGVTTKQLRLDLPTSVLADYPSLYYCGTQSRFGDGWISILFP